MDLPAEKHPPSPVTGRSPAKPVPVVEVSPAAPDEDADLNIGEEIFNRPVESIPAGPSGRGKRRPMNNDLNPPPSEVKEVEPRKKKNNPLEKRNTVPLHEFKRVVRPQTAFAASAAVDHAKAESPVPLDAVDRDAMEFGKVHGAGATPDFRPNKLHGVLDGAYKHSRLGWLDWVDRVGPRAIIGVFLVVLGGGFLTWRYFNSIGDQAAKSQEETVSTLSDAERIARGKSAVEQFIQAQTNEARLPLVMDPDRAGVRMAQFYGEGGRNPNITSWDVGAPKRSKNGAWLPFVFTDTAGREVTVVLGETASGCIIDWENFVAYGEMPWQEFCRAKPTSDAKALRVRLRRTERYQGNYTKEAWQSYDVEHRSGGPALTAYASRNGRYAQALEELVRGEKWQCALVYLRFDPASPQEGVVVIEDVVRSRWQDEATSWTGP